MKLEDNYDQQIAELRRKMEELESRKHMHVRKLDGIRKYQEMVAELVSSYGLTEAELFVSRAEAIVAWLKSVEKAGSEPPLYWSELRDYFAGKAPATEGKRGRGKKKSESLLPELKLPVGVYRNPFTGERVEKKRRNPKPLDEWIDEFGVAEVRTWIKPR